MTLEIKSKEAHWDDEHLELRVLRDKILKGEFITKEVHETKLQKLQKRIKHLESKLETADLKNSDLTETCTNLRQDLEWPKKAK